MRLAPPRAPALAALLLAAAGCSRQEATPAPAAGAGSASGTPAAAAGPAWLEPAEDAAGVDWTHVRGGATRYWFPEIMGGGVAFLDYDRDGALDLYLVQSGELDPAAARRPGNALYRNRGDGTFEDATARAGVGDDGYGMGVACGDYDADGHVDLYVTNVGANVLYRNRGDGTFEDATASAGVGDPGWGTSAAFVDVDGDGLLDLFVVNYLTWSIETELDCRAGSGERDYCSPNNYDRPARDVLYRNRGDGTFEDVTAAAGLGAAFGNGLGVTWADFDRDGDFDLYVANDGMANQLWVNDGRGRFSDGALVAGCAVNRHGTPEAGMGVAAADLDADGWFDLFMTHLRNESNTYYRNVGGDFTDATAVVGLSGPSIDFTGFGMGFADLDLDGWLDLFVANGRVGKWEPSPDPADPYAEPNLLFRGGAGGRFQEVSPRGGTATPVLGTSRGAAFGDYDGDGDVDVAVVESGRRLRLLRNVAGDGGRSAVLDVLDERGAPALGAVVEARLGERVLRRRCEAAYGYCASHDPRVVVGLGAEEGLSDVVVTWPDGVRERFGDVPAGAAPRALVRGAGEPAE